MELGCVGCPFAGYPHFLLQSDNSPPKFCELRKELVEENAPGSNGITRYQIPYRVPRSLKCDIPERRIWAEIFA